MTTENIHEDFRNLVAASTTLSARWTENSQYASARIQKILGIECSIDDILNLGSVKTATLCNAPVDEIELLEDAKNSAPAIAHRRQQEQIAAIEAGEAEALQHLNGMSRQRRMSFAREHGLTGGMESRTSDSSVTDPDNHLRVALSLNPAARISYMRKHGLA